jgi:hypothetical protein
MPPASVTFSGRSVRAQTAQVGMSSAPPRARSSATSRPTVGGAPRVNALGWVLSAAARLRSVAGRSATTASTASATTRRGSFTAAAGDVVDDRFAAAVATVLPGAATRLMTA